MLAVRAKMLFKIFWFAILNFLAIKIVGGIYFSKRAKKLALGVKMSAAQEKMLAV